MESDVIVKNEKEALVKAILTRCKTHLNGLDLVSLRSEYKKSVLHACDECNVGIDRK